MLKLLYIVNGLVFVCVGGWREAVWTELETAAGSVDVADLLHAVPVHIPLYRIYTPLPTPPNKAWWSPEGNNRWGHLQWCNASDSHCPRSTQQTTCRSSLLLVAFAIMSIITELYLYTILCTVSELWQAVDIWFGLSESCILIFCTWSLLFSISW